MVIYYN